LRPDLDVTSRPAASNADHSRVPRRHLDIGIPELHRSLDLGFLRACPTLRARCCVELGGLTRHHPQDSCSRPQTLTLTSAVTPSKSPSLPNRVRAIHNGRTSTRESLFLQRSGLLLTGHWVQSLLFDGAVNLGSPHPPTHRPACCRSSLVSWPSRIPALLRDVI
jgi:hypothetical protein